MSWRWETAHKLYTYQICVRCIVVILFIVCLFISIGGDETLETVTTLPSKSQAFFVLQLSWHGVHISTTRWQSWTVTKLVFCLLCSNFPTFFFLHQIFLSGSILKSKECQRDRGKRRLASMWLYQELKYREFLHFFDLLSSSTGSPSCILCYVWSILWTHENLIINRGIPGQVRRLIDAIKNDSVSLIYGTVQMHTLMHKF